MTTKKHTRRSVLRPKKYGKEYFLWCDESDRKGKFYSNFYGGVLVASDDLLFVYNALVKACRKMNFKDEIKWNKVSAPYLTKYKAVMDSFFDLIKQNRIKVRIMFSQNAFVPLNLTERHRDEEFFILYYHFIKHAFGFGYVENVEEVFIRIYFDYLPDTLAKRQAFKEYIKGLQSNREFQMAKIKIRKQDIAEVDSKKHLLLQMMDVVLGSMCFRLNNKHRDLPEGKKRRGKKTIAKEKLYKHIVAKIREIKPGFNIGMNTGIEIKSDYWHHAYRHWCFKPKEYQIDNELFK